MSEPTAGGRHTLGRAGAPTAPASAPSAAPAAPEIPASPWAEPATAPTPVARPEGGYSVAVPQLPAATGGAAPAPAAPPAGAASRGADESAFVGSEQARLDRRAARADTARAGRRPAARGVADTATDSFARVPKSVVGAAALFGIALAAVPFLLAGHHDSSKPAPRRDPVASYTQKVSPPGVVPEQASDAP